MNSQTAFHHGAVEAKLKLAEEVLGHSDAIVQLTIKTLLCHERDAKPAAKELEEHAIRIRVLIQKIAGRLTSKIEKDLFASASSRWFSITANEQSFLSETRDANQAAPPSEILLPALVDNACWRAFIEVLRVQLAEWDTDKNRIKEVAQRAGELVRNVHRLRSTIAEQKRMEERVCQLASIMDSSTDAIVVQTIGGTVASWNAGAESLYGYRANEILGKAGRLMVAQDRWDELSKALQTIAHGKSIPVHETVHIRKNGEEIVVSTTLSPVRDGEGEVIGAAAITRGASKK